jgi:hypothetical protein
MQTLERLKSENKVALWVEPIFNSLLDHSGNNNTITVVGGTMVNGTKGRGYLTHGAGQYLQVTHSSSVNLSSGVILVFFTSPLSRNPGPTNKYLVTKGGTPAFALSTNPGNATIGFQDATTNRSATTNSIGSYMLGARFLTGTCQGYNNGINIGNFSGTSTIVTNTSDIYINNWVNGDYSQRTPIGMFLLLKDTVTDLEISQIYTEYMNIRGAVFKQKRNFVLTNPKAGTGCVAHYDMQTFLSDGKLADLSGNGNHAAPAGFINSVPTIYGRGQNLKGKVGSAFVLPLTNTFGQQPFTIEAMTRAPVSVSDGNDAILSIEPAVPRFYVGTNRVSYNTLNTISVSSVNTGQWVHTVVRHDGTNLYLYRNGVLLSSVAAPLATIPAGPLYLMRKGSEITVMDTADIKLYNTDKGADFASAEYAKASQEIIYVEDFLFTPPTTVNVTSGTIPYTEFKVNSGSFKISETSAGRTLECVSDGVVEIVLPNANKYTTHTYTSTGTATLAKTATGFTITMTTGAKVSSIKLTI